MLTPLLYLMLIAGLVYWLENPGFLGTNSLKIRRPPAEVLEDWLKGFQFGNRSDLSSQVTLPKYKFYTEVLEILLSLARRMGGNYQETILYLRSGLNSDRQFEKKLKDMLLGLWLQMGLMMLLTWGFIFAATKLTEVNIALGKLGIILLWQGVGVGLLPFLLRHYRHKFFSDIGRLWKMLYVLNSLARVPLSRSEILTIAGVQDLKNIQQKNLLHIVEKLKDTCQRALKNGASYEEEVSGLMDELRFQEKWHFELFEKRLTAIKLVLMTVFFLPSYLAFIFLLLGDLLGQM